MINCGKHSTRSATSTSKSLQYISWFSQNYSCFSCCHIIAMYFKIQLKNYSCLPPSNHCTAVCFVIQSKLQLFCCCHIIAKSFKILLKLQLFATIKTSQYVSQFSQNYSCSADIKSLQYASQFSKYSCSATIKSMQCVSQFSQNYSYSATFKSMHNVSQFS